MLAGERERFETLSNVFLMKRWRAIITNDVVVIVGINTKCERGYHCIGIPLQCSQPVYMFVRLRLCYEKNKEVLYSAFRSAVEL